jgi:L-fuconolactonase
MTDRRDQPITDATTGDPPPVIDAHVHFWDPAALSYFWLEPKSALDRPFLPEELEPARLAAGVRSGVYVQASHDPLEIARALELTRQAPWVRGIVGWVDLEDPRVGEGLASVAHARLKGIRHLTHAIPDADWLGRKAVQRGLVALAEAKLSCDLVLRPDQLELAADVIHRHPRVQFVLDHLGNPPFASRDLRAWARSLEGIAAQPNAACKVSGLLTNFAGPWDLGLLREAVGMAFDLFGASRLMYGGDWPVSTLAATYAVTLEVVRAALPELEAPEAAEFWSGTATRVYRL